MTPAKIDRAALGTLTGIARRRAYMKLRAEANTTRRAQRRLPTRHALVIRELVRAQLLPALETSGLTAAEHRKLRNALKAMRKKHRA